MTAETEPSPAPDPEEPPKTSKIPGRVGTIAALALTAGIVGVILFYGYLARPGWIGVADKKFWDYLELLIVPAALALGVYWLNRAQSEREGQAEEAHRKRELEVENQRAQDAALQAYLDQIGELLLDKTPSLRGSVEGDDVRNLARARTLTVMWLVDGSRKGSLLQFLYESQLISKDRAVIDLSGAYLAGAHLWASNLREADLSNADLSNADLSGADLNGANLSGANLSGANLGGAYLRWADLKNTKLRDANLAGVGLYGANLKDAADVTEEQLAKCKSLEGATMPNGQKYEDWLKDKESRGEYLTSRQKA